MKNKIDIFVAGTDTGVGKSVVSLLLMQFFNAKDFSPFYVKPFQTGCVDPYDTDSDAAFVYRHVAALHGQDPAQSVIYCYPNPKAPFYAACDADEKVDPDKVRQVIVQRRLSHSPLVVEGAGGLMVPVTNDLLMIDLIRSLNCRPLIVAHAGLGTINHTLLTIEALHQRDMAPLGVVFMDCSPSPLDPDFVAENIEAVERIGNIRVGGVIPFIRDFSSPPKEAFQVLESLLML